MFVGALSRVEFAERRPESYVKGERQDGTRRSFSRRRGREAVAVTDNWLSPVDGSVAQ